MNNRACTRCRSKKLRRVDVIHHYLCAYVGPQYDFEIRIGELFCPKCARRIDQAPDNWEVVGHSLFCEECRFEKALPR
jgi:hypothetical protein